MAESKTNNDAAVWYHIAYKPTVKYLNDLAETFINFAEKRPELVDGDSPEVQNSIAGAICIARILNDATAEMAKHPEMTGADIMRRMDEIREKISGYAIKDES